ncbi:MAG: sensor domain-containing diguanylate cyclase [Alicyclobacillaceae bacterium]|nr:sensor domain-containing diguanylate cyclase [Alicyclobacillaceae bacterium]
MGFQKSIGLNELYWWRMHDHKHLADVMELAKRLIPHAELIFIASIDDDWFQMWQVSDENSPLAVARSGIPAEESYCKYLYDRPGLDILSLPDSAKHPYFSALPATQKGAVRSYVGAPLSLMDGAVSGTICAVHSQPGQFGVETESALKSFAGLLSRFLQMEELAIRDETSACYNRNFLHILLEYWSDDREYTLILYDIDDFKSVNDDFGHEAGDEAIAWIGHTLTDEYAGQLVLRLGGDEFCVLTDEADEVAIRTSVARVASQLARFPRRPLQFSVGVAGGPLRQFGKWMRMADAAMYRVKSKGKNDLEIVPREAPEIP